MNAFGNDNPVLLRRIDTSLRNTAPRHDHTRDDSPFPDAKEGTNPVVCSFPIVLFPDHFATILALMLSDFVRTIGYDSYLFVVEQYRIDNSDSYPNNVMKVSELAHDLFP